MKRKRVLFFGLACSVVLLLSICGVSPYIDIFVSWLKNKAGIRYSVDEQLDRYEAGVRSRLQPLLNVRGIAYPPARLSLVAFKDERRLELFVHEQKHSAAVFLKAYPFTAFSGDLGPKLREGDRQIPEGRYRVSYLNPNSLYHLSLGLDYPNAFDRRQAEREGRTNLGDAIMIHGNAVSIGCIAIGNAAIEEVFILAARAGTENIEVLIVPGDLRVKNSGTFLRPESPSWLADHYDNLAGVLATYTSSAM